MLSLNIALLPLFAYMRISTYIIPISYFFFNTRQTGIVYQPHPLYPPLLQRRGGKILKREASSLQTFLAKQSLYFAGGARVNLRTAVSAIGGRLKGCISSKIGLITSS